MSQEKRTSNPFEYAKRCPPNVQQKAKSSKRGLIMIGSITIILMISISVFLYYGMESSVYFKLNEYDTDGNPIGRKLEISEYPEEFNVTEGLDKFSLSKSNITRAYIGSVGFIFIEKNLLEKVIKDDHIFTLFMIGMQLKVGAFSSVFSQQVAEDFDQYIPYRDYLYNNSITIVMGNTINDRYNDLIWKFQANSYCIPIFNIKCYYPNKYDPLQDVSTDIIGIWTKLLTTRDIQDALLGHGIYEMRVTDIKYNYTSIEALATGDFDTILNKMTRPPCYFETDWLYRSWFYDGISVLKPVDQQKM